MAFSRADIDRVRERTDLAELAAEVTKVKRSGRSVMAICPFHDEKTPSLSIDPVRGLYHCFGCGKSGDVFRWVMDTQGLDFNAAVEHLARRTGVVLTPEPGAARTRDRRRRLVDAVEATVDFYHRRLVEGADAGAARGYLRRRGYDVDVVTRFRLGWAPTGWDGLVRHLRDRGIAEDDMVTAGLASRTRRGGLVDRFRGRIMFPIFDVSGDAVGFGARLLEGDGPKYLNSPETPLYRKSRLLYGLNWAKAAVVRAGEAVVVEGYTDVIACHLADVPTAVATCGTSLGTEHLDLLRRFAPRILLAFDADEAGAGAAVRGFETALGSGLDLRVVALPSGKDPADLVRDGEVERLREAVAASRPLLQFRIERELEGFDLTEPEARGRAVRAVAGLVAVHPDEVARHEYAVLVARRTGVDVEVVERAVTAVRGEAGRRGGHQAPAATPEAPLTGVEKAEQELLRLLLANDPRLRREEVEVGLLSREEHRRGFELVAPTILALPPGRPPDLGSLIGGDDSDEAELLRRLALDDRPLPDAGEVVLRLRIAALQRRIEDLRSSLARLGPDDEGYSDTFAELIALERRRRELETIG